MKYGKKLHYGWVVCFVCMILAFCAVGCVNSSFGVYFPFMREESGITNTQCSMLTTIRNLAAVITMTQVDKYLERMGIRRGVLVGMSLTVFSMLLYGTTNNYIVYCIAAIVAGAGYTFAGLVTISVIISQWFITHRTFAVGLAVMGTGFATIFMPPIVTKLATLFSLRTAFFTVAGIIVLAMAVVFVMLPEKPSDKGLEPINDVEAQTKNKVEAETTASRPVLIMVMISLIIMGHPIYGTVPNLALLFTTEGLSKEFAAFLISLFGITMTIGKAVYGKAVDRFGVVAATVAAVFLNVAALWLMVLCGLPTVGSTLAVMGCVLFGPGNAIATVGQPALATYFARSEDYAKTMKKFQVAYMAGSVAIGPLPGILADLFGSYVPAYLIFSVEILISLVILLAAFSMVKKERSAM